MDIDRHDPTSYLRTEVNPADLARAKQEWELQAQRDHNAAMTGVTVIATIIALLCLSIVIHRRKILRSTDAAIVAGAAVGLRAARKVRSKRDAWFSRVAAKADETSSPKT